MKESYDKPRGILKSRGIILPTKIRIVEAMVFPVLMYGKMWKLDHKKVWAANNWCFWIVVLQKNLNSPLYCKEIKSINPEGNLSWIFIGRIDVEAEGPKFWTPDAKIQLIGKDPEAEKDWKEKEKGVKKRMKWLDSITDSIDMCVSKLWEIGKDRKACCVQLMRSQSQTQLGNWTTYLETEERKSRCFCLKIFLQSML